MRFLQLLVAFCCLPVACSGFLDTDPPPAAVRINPPAHFRTWWAVVESCAGRVAPFDAVSWYSARQASLIVRGQMAAGVWRARSNEIIIVDARRVDGALVRHEMLHAILRDGAHPGEYFLDRCGEEVGAFVAPARPPAATEVALEVLESEAELFPSDLSLSALDGRATVIVRVRNPTSHSVAIDATRFGEVKCAVGFVISSAIDPSQTDLACGYLHSHSDGRLHFRPGETRRLLFEVNLKAPYGRKPLEPGLVTVSAIFADNIRKTVFSTLRP